MNSHDVKLSYVGLGGARIAEGLVLRRLGRGGVTRPSNIDRQVSDVLTRDVVTASRDCAIAKVIRMFQSRRIRCIPVVDDERRLVGIVGRKDILRYFAENF